MVMEDPVALIAILKVVLMLVLIVASGVIGRELVAMARGRSVPRSRGTRAGEQ
jgi:hypothetical protein